MPQVGIIFCENASRATAMAQAKFASLAAAGRQFTNHEGTSRPSLPDYEATIAGAYSPAPWSEGVFGGVPTGRDGPTGIGPGYWASQANLFTQLAGAGHSWKSYEEGVNGPGGYTTWGNAGTGSLHVSRHCPASFFTATKNPGVHPANGRYDFDELVADMSAQTLPDFFWLTPNNVNNGHDTGVAAANQWLVNGAGGLFPGIDQLRAALRPDGLLILTFDNIPTADTTQPITGTGVVYCVVLGPGVAPSTDPTYYTHFSLTAAIQSLFGLPKFTSLVDSHYTSAPALQLSTGTVNTPTAPVITTPSQNQQFTGTSVTTSWNASTGGTAPLTYTISKDGGSFGAPSASLTDTSTYAKGSHTVTVKVTDANSQTATSAISFQTGVVTGPVGPLITIAYDSSNPRFVNAAGDHMLLRGVDIEAEAASTLVTTAVGMGINMVRIACGWDAFEATAPTGSGTNYSSYVHTLSAGEVSGLDAMCQTFAQNGVHIQIDFHQASWSPYFSGHHGVPSWYYTDSRFKVKQNGGSGWSTSQQSAAIEAFWDDANEKPMAQTLYNAWATKMVQHVTAQSYAPHVVGYQIFNEPNPGGMAGSSQAKTSVMQKWLSTTVDAIRAVDTTRAIFVMCHGGGQGYGDAIFTDAYGSVATMQSKNMVMEFHSYYTGQLPGHNANSSGDVGFGASTNNDEYFPNSNACHNTPQGSSYTGSQAGQEGFISVPLAKAAAIGLPFFQGEMGVLNTDPGRLNYIKHYQAVLDAHQLSAVVWLMASTGTTGSLNLVTNGSLNDMGQAWAKWFKATNFNLGGGGGGGGGGSPPINTAPPVIPGTSFVDGQTVTFSPGTWSNATLISDKFQVSTGSDPLGTWTDAP